MLPPLVGAALLAASLSYIESSQGLLDTPRFEAGNTEFEMADLNGDGFVDLISIGDHGNPLIGSQEQGVMAWLGDGRGGWTYRHAGDLGYGGIAVGDLDGDGTADIAYGMHHDYASSDFGDAKLEAALGDGTGFGWTPWDDGLAQEGQSWGLFSTDLADVDGNGALDVASGGFGASDGLHVYLNDGDGRWRRSFGYLGGNSGNVLAFGEIDGDGVPDLGVSKEEGTAWLGDGDGFYAAADGTLPPVGAWGWRDGVSLGDVDGDGHDDVAWCDAADNAQVWLWRTGAQWTNASAGLPADGRCGRTQLHDMDGDGATDLVTLGARTLRVIAGNGAGTAWSVAATVTLPDTPGDAERAARRGGRRPQREARHRRRRDPAGRQLQLPQQGPLLPRGVGPRGARGAGRPPGPAPAAAGGERVLDRVGLGGAGRRPVAGADRAVDCRSGRAVDDGRR